uniref:Cholinergic receptor, nicotinic, beta 1 (muscle) like n=1 Tax=Oncorhynchus kisutch TaxID=8019 RepID=A0A8C7CMN3_ONCKI
QKSKSLPSQVQLHQKIFHNYNLKAQPAKHWEQKIHPQPQSNVYLSGQDEKNEAMTTNDAWTDYSDETVNWLPPAIYRSSCPINQDIIVAYFPFDWQSCIVVFCSYTYNSSEVGLQYAMDENEEEIQDIDENALIGYKEVSLRIYVVLRGRCLSSLFILYLFFRAWMTLTITVLITGTVPMLLLTDKVPETSLCNASPLLNYVMFTMIVVTFSVILSVVVLNLHPWSPSTHKVTRGWVGGGGGPKYIILVCVHLFVCVFICCCSLSPPFHTPPPPPLRSENAVQLQGFFDSDNYCLILPPDLKSAIAAVTYMAEQLKKQDWQYIATVVDRLFLWLLNYTPEEPFPLGQ